MSKVAFCCYSVDQSCLTLCDPMDHSMPGLSIPHHLPKFAQVHVHFVGDAIQPSHPLMPSSPSALNLSYHQGLFQCVSFSHQMTKIWSFSFSISPSNEYSGLISLKIDRFDLVVIQVTLRSFLQHQSSKASILQCSTFFIVQLSDGVYQPYISHKGLPGGAVVKNPPINAGDLRDASSTPGSGRYTETGNFTHSSILARRLSWTEEPNRLEPKASYRII